MKVGSIMKFGYRIKGNIVNEYAEVISTHKKTSGLNVVEAKFQDGTLRKYSQQHLLQE